MSQKQSSVSSLFRWSLSEIRQGHLWPISAALILVIASIFALSALANRMEQVVVKQGKDALTADAVFVSANPVPDSLREKTADLPQSEMTRFSTMAFSDEGMQLITVRAVDSVYPLKGTMELEGSPHGHVKPGEAWFDERILAQLNIDKGDVVTVGDADFIVSGRILSEPGLTFNPFQTMPSIYIHLSDVDKTGAIQVGSRVQYQLFLEADRQTVEQLEETTEISPSDRWRTDSSANRSNEVFERTTQYLSLTVAIVIMMAATTLVLTCQHYVNTRVQTIAMLKSLGATQHWIERWMIVQISLLIGSASVIGLLLGSGLEWLLRIPLASLLPDPLPSMGFEPAIVAIVTAVLITIPALGIPLLELIKTPALAVMQSDVRSRSNKRLLLVLVPLAPLIGLYASNTLVWIVLAAIVLLFIVLGLLSVVLSKVIRNASNAPAFKLALSRINRSPIASGVQFGALALSLMLLSIIWLVRSDILNDWQRTLPADAPNVFALNIADYELGSYIAQLDDQQIEYSNAFPIIRGRLSEINGVAVAEMEFEGEKPDPISRELNLTWGETLPEYNEILDGEWTNNSSVSVEEEVAKELGIEVGDKLRFDISGQVFFATVDTIREVEWRDMNPNFYFIFSQDVMKDIPGSYLISYRIDDQHSEFLTQLTREFPTVSVMDIRSMGDKIQTLVGHIVTAITILATLGVLAGLLLIFTLLRLSLGQRQREIQLYRTLGASQKRIQATVWIEYGVMALIASVIAAFGAEIAVGAIIQFGLELTPQLHPTLWIALPLMTFMTLGLVVATLLRKLLTPVSA